MLFSSSLRFLDVDNESRKRWTDLTREMSFNTIDIKSIEETRGAI